MLTIKKQVKDDWTSAFTDLFPFSQNKFYKVNGCLIIGIESVNVSNIDGYKPHFVIYPLWKKDLQECLDIPIIYFCIKDKKGFQYDIPYTKHALYFGDALECFKNEVPIPMKENVSSKTIFEFIEKQFNDILIKSNSAQQAKLFEAMFYIALYVGNENKVQEVLNQIKDSSKNWNLLMFEKWYGNFDLWFRMLQKVSLDKEHFIGIVEKNKQDKRITKLKYSEILN